MASRGTVCVTGGAGFVGSWLVMKQGNLVNATVRDPGLNEVIKPAVNGMLNIMRSCLKAKTVKRIVFTSSAGTVNVQERQLPQYDENSWSDLEFIRAKKMTGWMYFVSKILSGKAAWEFAVQNNKDLITIIPTLVVGPFIMPSMPPSLTTALALITGNEAHYSILKQVQFVHLDDLCNAHIFLFENPEAKGRYVCSSHSATIIDLAKMLRERFPKYHVPIKFSYEGESLEVVSFSSRKHTEFGFEFKYSLEDMYMGAIESAREKGLLPLSHPNHVDDKGLNSKQKSEEAEKTNGIQEELKGEGSGEEELGTASSYNKISAVF